MPSKYSIAAVLIVAVCLGALVFYLRGQIEQPEENIVECGAIAEYYPWVWDTFWPENNVVSGVSIVPTLVGGDVGLTYVTDNSGMVNIPLKVGQEYDITITYQTEEKIVRSEYSG